MAVHIKNKNGPSWEKVCAHNIYTGDHVCWTESTEDRSVVKLPYIRHAIVTDCGPNTLWLTGWRFHSDKLERKYNPKIVQEEIDKSQQIKFHRAVYKGPCYSARETVHRAKRLLDEQPEYHFVTNFARAMPRYCKTGYGGFTFSLQGLHIKNKNSPSWDKVSIHQLCRGDHVCWTESKEDRSIVKLPYVRHAIVMTCEENMIMICGWRFHTDNTLKTYQPKIVKEALMKSSNIHFRRAVYEGPCYSAEDTITRAKQLLDEQPEYHFVTNFARALPRYCKTGYGGFTFSLHI